MVRKLFNLVHKLWVEAQLSAPPFLQKTAIAFFQRTKEVVRLVVRPYFPVDQFQGQSYGGRLTVTYAGLPFAKVIVRGRFFTEEPTEKSIGHIPFWRIGELVDDKRGDITVIAAPKWLVNRLPRRAAFVLPHYVDQIVSLLGSWDDVKGRMHKNLRKSEFRRIRKYGYEYEISHKDEDLERFYHDMYLPTVGDRHGELSDPMSLREAYQVFHHGWLILIKRDGNYVAGGLCHQQDNVVLFVLVGVLGGDSELMQEGAQGAVYHAVLNWSHQNGYEAANFMGCPPYLRGVYQHKRRWGAYIALPDDEHKLIWLKIQHDTPAVEEFMKENPSLVLDDHGDLQALIITDSAEAITDETRKSLQKEYFTPGINGYLICSFNDLMAESYEVSAVDISSPL